MKVNFNRRLELRETTIHPVTIFPYYLCISHSELDVLKGPHIIGFDDLDNVELYAKSYQDKKYNVLVTFSYPFEIAELWKKKK